MKAMIFAAGLGTRLKEETLYKPKALVEVGGKPLLQHAIEKLKKERFSEVVVNVHHFSDLVIEFVKNHDFGIPVHISDETGKLLDTGGGLKKATPLLAGNQPVLIYNVDILSNIDLQILVQEYLRSGALAMLVVRKRQTQRYFKFNGEKRLVGWINKKTDEKKIAIPEKFGKATEMAFSGIHIVGPEIFQLLPAEEKFSITDFYLDLAKDHLIKGYFDASEIWMDVGKPHELEEARKWFKSH
jgi:NDP-sugar pyrophosphorylase family protein